MDSVSRRSFIGVISSFFLLRKPIKLDEFKIIKENIIVPKDKCSKPLKVIPVNSPDIYCLVPLTGCNEDGENYVIEDLKSYKYKEIYIYNVFDEDGNYLNCFGAGAPHIIGGFDD